MSLRVWSVLCLLNWFESNLRDDPNFVRAFEIRKLSRTGAPISRRYPGARSAMLVPASIPELWS